MSGDREKPLTWPWIVVAIPILYVASFGPASWLASWDVLPLKPTARFYLPIFLAHDHGPSWLREAIEAYTRVGEWRDGEVFGQLSGRSGAYDLTWGRR